MDKVLQSIVKPELQALFMSVQARPLRRLALQYDDVGLFWDAITHIGRIEFNHDIKKGINTTLPISPETAAYMLLIESDAGIILPEIPCYGFGINAIQLDMRLKQYLISVPINKDPTKIWHRLTGQEQGYETAKYIDHVRDMTMLEKCSFIFGDEVAVFVQCLIRGDQFFDAVTYRE